MTCGCTAPHKPPALWTVPPCTQTLGEVGGGGQGIFCGSLFVLNTSKGGSSSGKNPLPTTPLFFLMWMNLGHVSGEPALEGGYSSKVSKAPRSCGMGSCLFLLCHPRWRVPKAPAHLGGILGCNWRKKKKKNLKNQPLCMQCLVGRASCGHPGAGCTQETAFEVL